MSAYRSGRTAQVADEIMQMIQEESPTRTLHAAFETPEDQALLRMQQRASERRKKQMARMLDENTSEDERQRIQKEMERERLKQLDVLRTMDVGDSSAADAALLQQLEKNLSAKKGVDAKALLAQFDEIDEQARREEATALLTDIKTLSSTSESERSSPAPAASKPLASMSESDKELAAPKVANSTETPATPANATSSTNAAATSTPTPARGAASLLRVGVIGAGMNTRTKHIPLLQCLENVRVTHVANRSLDSTQSVARQCKIDYACK
jgi:hypothetical protein